MHFRLQSGTRHGRERPVAAFRSLWRCPERQSHSRPANQQVQGFRFRHHDQLRRSSRSHPVAQWLHAR